MAKCQANDLKAIKKEFCVNEFKQLSSAQQHQHCTSHQHNANKIQNTTEIKEQLNSANNLKFSCNEKWMQLQQQQQQQIFIAVTYLEKQVIA